MAATSFNGTTATIGGTSVLVQSINITKGDAAVIDVTSSSSTRRLQIAGFVEPQSIVITGHAESGSIAAVGSTYTVVIGSNTPMAATYTGWLCTSIEYSGGIDESNTFTATFIEEASATIT